jgi:hypothetical protein
MTPAHPVAGTWPLLTKVLADAFWSTEVEAPNSPSEMVQVIPPDIADRLEAALDDSRHRRFCPTCDCDALVTP